MQVVVSRECEIRKLAMSRKCDGPLGKRRNKEAEAEQLEDSSGSAWGPGQWRCSGLGQYLCKGRSRLKEYSRRRKGARVRSTRTPRWWESYVWWAKGASWPRLSSSVTIAASWDPLRWRRVFWKLIWWGWPRRADRKRSSYYRHWRSKQVRKQP